MLPRLEADWIELQRLQALAWKGELRIVGLPARVAGPPLEPRADGRETTPEDIRKVTAFQCALFGDDTPAMVQGGVIPSSLRVSWWKGF